MLRRTELNGYFRCKQVMSTAICEFLWVVQAVRRGLDEELGIQVSESAVVGPLQPAHLRKLEIPGKIRDFEFVQSFR